MTISKHDYELCEKENENLRAILRWIVPFLPSEHLEKLSVKLARPIESGGVAEDEHDDVQEENRCMAKILAQIAEHFQPALDDWEQKRPIVWFQRADHLLNLAREFEPKEPLMKRVGNYPNVYKLIKKEER